MESDVLERIQSMKLTTEEDKVMAIQPIRMEVLLNKLLRRGGLVISPKGDEVRVAFKYERLQITRKPLKNITPSHKLFEALANLLGAWRIRLLRLRGQCPFTLDDAFFPAVHEGKSHDRNKDMCWRKTKLENWYHQVLNRAMQWNPI
nr:hypothetical protein CFP56_48480 [Quercus suber]